jgi:hypothetical protein
MWSFSFFASFMCYLGDSITHAEPEIKVTKNNQKPAETSLPGPVHILPADLQEAIEAIPAAKNSWNLLTPLARNEWICWVTSAKKDETRTKRINRTQEDLAAGKRRPCCWPGCPHRNPSNAKWLNGKTA